MINIIAAVAKNGVIGNHGSLPWHIPEDLKHFKTTTTNSVLIMGKNTYFSINKVLKNRKIIVVSTSQLSLPQEIEQASDLNTAILLGQKFLDKQNYKEIFLCGGQKIFEEGLHFADKLIITKINQDFKGDTYFPKIDSNTFCLKSCKPLNSSTHDNLQLCLYTLQP